jgi:uncharacterized membrane protein YhaH (DUF805 family)
MSWTALLFSFQGRINRKPWWIAVILVGFATGASRGILGFVAYWSGNFVFDLETDQFTPTGIFRLATGAIGLADMWINLALGAKRLHDRDRSGWWLLLQFVAVLLAAIFITVAIAVPKGLAAAWYGVAVVSGTLAFVISLWLFVEMGFLRGTSGANRFGPDPLDASKSKAVN